MITLTSVRFAKKLELTEEHRNNDFNTFVKNGIAPVEHRFNNHQFCDAIWCYAKHLEENLHRMICEKSKNKVK